MQLDFVFFFKYNCKHKLYDKGSNNINIVYNSNIEAIYC